MADLSLFPYTREDFFSVQEVDSQPPWAITAFDLPAAWEATQGEGIVIGVVDTGVDLDHPDLAPNLLPGLNLLDKKMPPVDGLGHGTHVTGILVALNDGQGVVGVSPLAKVRPVKVLDDEGNGHLDVVAQGIGWAVEQGCDFISLSLGSPVSYPVLHRAIQAAEAAGVIVFCAAGNAGNTTSVFYPAFYRETISIGAIDRYLRRAVFSNTGVNLDFMAPGVDVVSTVPPHWYAKLSGTSMASPFACGVAALLKSYARQHPEIGFVLNTAEDYRQTLKRYTTPVVNGNYEDPHFYEGFGIIDPRKFIEALGLKTPGKIGGVGIATVDFS